MALGHIKGLVFVNSAEINLPLNENILFKQEHIEDQFLINAFLSCKLNRNRENALFIYEKKPELFTFQYLDPSIHKELKKIDIFKLSPLYEPLQSKSYDEILEVLFPEYKIKSIRKRVGLSIEKFGNNLINNILGLNLLNPKFNLDQILNLNHDLEISQNTYSLLKSNHIYCTFLNQLLTLDKAFNLLTNINDEIDFSDSLRMIGEIVENGLEITELKKELRKIKLTSEELHHKLVEIYNVKVTNRINKALNQDIIYLNGMKLFEYIIEVPMYSQELLETGKKLNHCVGTYSNSVISKECQILNLRLNNEMKYTIEIIFINKKPSINQFKGKDNSNEMEGIDGAKYIEALLKMILH